MTDPQSTPPSQQAGLVRVVGAVLSAFVGIRRSQAADRDHAAIKPVHIIVAGVIGGLLFIATLVTVVHFIIAR